MQASRERANLICFPECFVPGYRTKEKRVPPPDPAFLEQASSVMAAAAAKANIAVILGTERIIEDALAITALEVNPDGTVTGFQDKIQIDPSEEAIYAPGSGRRLFQTGPLTFGVVICHHCCPKQGQESRPVVQTGALRRRDRDFEDEVYLCELVSPVQEPCRPS